MKERDFINLVIGIVLGAFIESLHYVEKELFFTTLGVVVFGFTIFLLINSQKKDAKKGLDAKGGQDEGKSK